MQTPWLFGAVGRRNVVPDADIQMKDPLIAAKLPEPKILVTPMIWLMFYDVVIAKSYECTMIYTC